MVEILEKMNENVLRLLTLVEQFSSTGKVEAINQESAVMFFQNMMREIDVTAVCLRQRGYTISIEIVDSGEWQKAALVRMGLSSEIENQTATNLFFSKGQKVIHCLTLEGEHVKLNFTSSGMNSTRVVAVDNFSLLDANGAATLIMKRMVDILRSR